MTAYLQPEDYAAFGIAGSTAAQVETASRMVDSVLGRPEGLLWKADANGEPAYMAGLTPSRSYTLAGPISPGTNLPLTIPGAVFGLGQMGGTVIIDRAGQCEVATVIAATGNTITLDGLQLAHPAGATLEFGLVIAEQIRSRCDETFRIRRPPLAKLLSIYGGQDRHSCFGLPSYGPVNTWNAFPLGQTDYDASSGTILLSPGPVSPAFAQARIEYVAGWSYATLPAGIKQAVAALVSSQMALTAEGFSANVKVLKSGDGTIERFAGVGGGSSLFDSTIMNLIAPYRIYRL